MSCRLLAGAFMALVGLGSASAAEPAAVVFGPGDQTAPSLSNTRLAYVDGASGLRQVWVRDLETGEAVQVSSGAVDHGDPDLDRTTAIFTSADGVHLVTVDAGGGATFHPAAGAARATLSSALAAWEQAGPGGRDVAVLPLGAAAPLVLAGAGDEHAPSVAFGWVAWLDEAGAGAIRLRDEGGTVTTVRVGRAEKVSLWAATRLVPPILAASVPGAAGDQDLVVLDADGTERARLALPGVQRNPTLSGEWVGFEDLATGVSQVGVWQWSTGRVLAPSPASGEQRLNDVTVAGDELRVAWADGRGGDLDIFLFRATLPLPEVPPGQARCDDPQAQVVADLALTTDRTRHAAGAVEFSLAKTSALLACVDGVDAEAAWVQVAATAIELPFEAGTGPGGDGDADCDHGDRDHDDRDDHGHGDRDHDDRGDRDHGDRDHGDRDRDHDDRDRDDRDHDDRDHDDRDRDDRCGHGLGHRDDGHRGRGHDHHPGDDQPCGEPPPAPILRHAEARLTAPAGPALLGAVLVGRPGATLRVRVLADGWVSSARSGCLTGVDCPPAATEPAPPASGCASGGGGGLLALLFAPALLRCRPRRPRAAGDRGARRAC